MKSAHRHELETNALAKRLDVAIERFRPYASTVAGAVVAVVVGMFLWSYLAGASSARQSQAWDAYNQAVAGLAPNLEQLRQSAEEHPGTKMQQMADVTWADGQVWMAARDYLYNRAGAMEALNRATSRYQSIIQSSDDERLANRAALGLARVYEMQNEFDKARQQYLTVKGGYEEYAKLQADRLAEAKTKATYAWLATAQPPRPKAPAGPGTPGQRPEFSAGDFALPGAAADGGAPGDAAGDVTSFENLLQGLDLSSEPAGTLDRYAPGEEPPAQDEPTTENSGDTEPNRDDAGADQPTQ